MTSTLSLVADGRQQFINANGEPLVGGTVATYIPGTLIPKTTYSDSSGLSTNPNPLTLDALGSAAIWGSGYYRQIVKDASGNVIWDQVALAPLIGASGLGVILDDIPALQGSSIDSSVNAITLNGYSSAGDGGNALYMRSGSMPTTPLRVQSADGAWWKYVPEVNGINVKAAGAKGDGTTDDSAAFATALSAAIAQGASISIPAGVYRAWLYIESSNISIRGAGSKVTTIKIPDNASYTIPTPTGNQTGVPTVISFGQIGLGNSAAAFTSGQVFGLTLDGNIGGTSVPGSDLFGWGLAFTKYSFVDYSDIKVLNTHAGGVGQFINSNYHFGQFFAQSCGASVLGGEQHPGLDINSSNYSTIKFVAKDCAYGGRLLDNCYGNEITGTIDNATRSGFIYNNQLVNASAENSLHLSIKNGCGDQGIAIGANISSSIVQATIANVTAFGIKEVVAGLTEAQWPQANIYDIATSNCGLQGCIIAGSDSDWTITSNLDGRAGAQGSTYAVDVQGKRNKLSVSGVDSNPWHVRGVAFRAGSDSNWLRAISFTNTPDPIDDFGTNNILPPGWTTYTAPATPTASGYTLNPYGNVDPVQYTRANNRVSCRGVATRAGGPNGAIFTLPVGYRPSFNMMFGDSAGDTAIVVATDGTVSPLSAGIETVWTLDFDFDVKQTP